MAGISRETKSHRTGLAASLFGVTSISDVLARVEHAVKGRLLVFFSGRSRDGRARCLVEEISLLLLALSEDLYLTNKLLGILFRPSEVLLIGTNVWCLVNIAFSRSKNFGSDSAICAMRTCKIRSCAKTRRSRSVFSMTMVRLQEVLG
jgi:hypothetical protein